MMRIQAAMIVFLLSMGGSSRGADGDAQQRLLVEAARKEGKMIFYTSVETEFARSLTSAFEAKYPFIKTDIFRSTHDKIFSRMNIERQTNTYVADVVSVGELKSITCRRKVFSRLTNLPTPPSMPRDSKTPMATGPISTTT